MNGPALYAKICSFNHDNSAPLAWWQRAYGASSGTYGDASLVTNISQPYHFHDGLLYPAVPATAPFVYDEDKTMPFAFYHLRQKEILILPLEGNNQLISRQNALASRFR